MAPQTCHINALLASTSSDNQFNQTTVNRLAPVVDEVIKNSKMQVSKALFIYYAAVEEDCDVYLRANIQKLFKNVTVECINPGMEVEMIDQAEELGRLTLLSYPMIAIPATLMMMAILYYIWRTLHGMTGLSMEELLVSEQGT